MKKLLLGLIACLSFSVNASLIAESNYVVDTAQGLDWLRWDETNNRSYNDVVSNFGIGGDFEGWTYATASQAETFLANFGFTNYQNNFWSPDAINDADAWRDLTQYMGFDNTFWNSNYNFLYAMVDSTNQSRAMSFNHTYYVNDVDPYRHFTQTFGFSESLSLLGSFLVRDTSYVPPAPTTAPMILPISNPTQVSEPATVMLMLLTLGGLFGLKRLRK